MLFDQNIVNEAVSSFRSMCDEDIDLAVILGSGLAQVGADWEHILDIPFSGIKHLPYSPISGHSAVFSLCRHQSKNILLMRGRSHLYQGYSAFQVSLPVAMIAGLGIKNLVVTNACGSLHKDWQIGDIMMIEDHINLQSVNCLQGAPHSFIDMSSVYDRGWVSLVASRHTIRKGVYAGFSGPSYETPAEIRMAAGLGADVVGMSTVQEVIMARYYDMKICGISMISNLAAGISSGPLSHAEVLEAGARAGDKVDLILSTVAGAIR